MKYILHIDLNAFFATCSEITNPTYKNKPLAVCNKTRRSVVSTANYVARKYGVKSGMPAFMAYKLCPSIIFVESNFELYQHYSYLFTKIIAEKFTNQIEKASIDECYLDITKLVNDKKTPYSIAFEIQKTIFNELELGTSIGIGHNKFTAKMASDMKKPMGITELLTEKDIVEKLWPVKIEDMYFVGKSSANKLKINKINTIGDLAKCEDYAMLKRIFNKNWKNFLDNANGLGSTYIDLSNNTPKSISSSETVLFDTNDEEEIKNIIKKLTKDIERRMKEYNLYAKTLTFQFKFSNFHIEHKSITINDYVSKWEEMLPYFYDLYDQYFYGQTGRLFGVGVSNLINKEEYESTKYNLFNLNLENTPVEKVRKTKTKQIIDKINLEFNQNILTTANKKLKALKKI